MLILRLQQFSNELVNINTKLTVKCWHVTGQLREVLVAYKVKHISTSCSDWGLGSALTLACFDNRQNCRENKLSFL